MMMQMLQAGGVRMYPTNSRSVDEDNPRGYFECSPDRTPVTIDAIDLDGKAVKVTHPWILKVENLKIPYCVLMMRRSLVEVTRSQQLLACHRGQPIPEFETQLARLRAATLQLENWKRDKDVLTIDYGAIVKFPASAVLQVSSWLNKRGFPVLSQAMTDAIDSRLYRNRQAQIAELQKQP